MDKGIVGNKEHGNQNRWEGNRARPYFGEAPLPLCNGEVDVDGYDVRQSYEEVDETVPEPHVLSEDNEEFLADQKVAVSYESGDLIDVRNRFRKSILQETAQQA